MRFSGIFETHAHYDDSRYDADRDQLISSLPGMNISTVVNVGSDMASLEKCKTLACKYDFFYYTAGIHPSEIKDLSKEDISIVEEYAEDERCVAIGEIGLDYHWEKEEEDRQYQKTWFNLQLDVAKRHDMPVVIHSREACEDTLDILKEVAKTGLVCDIHCFSYSTETAFEFIKLGFYIGIGGVLTYNNAKKLRATVENIPLKSILLETDCPYLTPHPFRGRRNDSTYLPYVVKTIAGIRGITEEEVIEVTSDNARRFYGL